MFLLLRNNKNARYFHLRLMCVPGSVGAAGVGAKRNISQKINKMSYFRHSNNYITNCCSHCVEKNKLGVVRVSLASPTSWDERCVKNFFFLKIV
jgi:hypothetical protein